MKSRSFVYGILGGVASVSLAVGLLATLTSLGSEISPRRRLIELTYETSIHSLPPGTRQVRAWIPLPSDGPAQKLMDYEIESPWPAARVWEPEHNNHFLRFDITPDSGHSIQDPRFSVSFRVQREAYHPLDEQTPRERPPPENVQPYLRASRLIPINGPIAREAAVVARGEKEAVIQARRLYDHIIQTVSYDKSGQGWGQGDALYACSVRAGNCTDFHSLFIGEARALGIPARFIMGLPLPEDQSGGVIPGYHCWAEFYLPDRGWVPIDASEAHKNPERIETLFGGLDAHRIRFTTGRDIRLPGSESKPINYSIYPHVEVEGKVHEQVTTQFTFHEINPRAASAGIELWKPSISIPVLVILLLLETGFPLFQERRERFRHGLRHVAIALLNALPLSLISATLMVGVADLCQLRGWGLLYLWEVPSPWGAVVAILAQDAWMYWWHRANHLIPWLWRFHRMHHSDPRMDATTAFRFHTGEVFLSALLRLGVIALVGLQVWHLVLYEILLLPVIMLHHSNLALPRHLDRLLRLVIVTPAVHQVHHSRQVEETNSNYASVFSWWDRLAGTYRLRADPRSIRFGLAGWDHRRHQTLWGLLLTPFISPTEEGRE